MRKRSNRKATTSKTIPTWDQLLKSSDESYEIEGYPSIYVSRDKGKELIKHFPYFKKGGTIIISLPKEVLTTCLRQVVHKPSFSPCVFEAVDEYCSSLLGVRLSEEDKEWIAAHPWSDSRGVPEEATLHVVQGLLEPYGLGISRVRVVGYLTHPNFREWERALGVNAFYSRGYSNEKAAGGNQTLLAKLNEQARFEISSEPLRPSVLGTILGKEGMGLGHAVYLPPRGGVNSDWAYSFQIDRLERIKYHQPVKLPEYVPRAGTISYSIQWSRIKVDGRRLFKETYDWMERTAGYWHPWWD